MKKLVILSFVTICAAVSFAAIPGMKPKAKRVLTPEEKAKQAEMRQAMYEHFGDDMKDARKQKGKVVIVNCQKSADAAWLKTDAAMMEKELQVAVQVADGAFDLQKPVVQGEASIFVVDDPALPMSLVATESRWAMVNVAQLKSEKVKFFEMRVKKAVARTFALLCGGAGSQFKLSLTECILKAEDYDIHINEFLPFDVNRRMTPYLEAMGITRWKKSNYREACQEGWAPNPTNAVQKAIWDEIHALPEKPIKIEFDPKKDK